MIFYAPFGLLLRVGRLNVMTVTGRGRELADMMEMLECCVRLDGGGTHWGGCKLLLTGANEQEWNGVG